MELSKQSKCGEMQLEIENLLAKTLNVILSDIA